MFQHGQNHICFKRWEERRFSGCDALSDTHGSTPGYIWPFGLRELPRKALTGEGTEDSRHAGIRLFENEAICARVRTFEERPLWTPHDPLLFPTFPQTSKEEKCVASCPKYSVCCCAVINAAALSRAWGGGNNCRCCLPPACVHPAALCQWLDVPPFSLEQHLELGWIKAQRGGERER